MIDILDTDQRRTLENVRAAAVRIWARPLHRYYTDHTVAHSERLIALLDGLTAGMATTDKRLSPAEVFVLLAAAYLHDIGMQDERFAGGDLEAIREAHHEVTAELIYHSLPSSMPVGDRSWESGPALDLGLSDDPGLVEAVALVAKGHRRVDLASADYEPLVHGGETVRLRLLAALLRFADELDIDHRRVDLEQMKLLALPVPSQLHWWKCHYVSGVNIVDEYIKIAYRFPQKRPEYEGLIVPLVERDIRTKHAALEEIFRANAVKVALAMPQVRLMRTVQPLPPEVEELARRRAGEAGEASPRSVMETLPCSPASRPLASSPPLSPRVSPTVFDQRGQTVGTQVNVAGNYVSHRSVNPAGNAENERLQRALDMARRTLAILEEQAAGFGKLHAPAHLRIELEEKRRQVAELEAKLGIAPTSGEPTPPTPEPAPVPSPARRDYFDLQVRIRGLDTAAQAYPVEAQLGDGSHFEGGLLRLDREALYAAELNPQRYGLALFDALFAGPLIRAYERAKAYADVRTDSRLRLRLWMDGDAAELHALAWERLHHVVQGAALPVAASMETPFSRYVGLETREPDPIAERPVRVLFAISNPAGLSDYGLALLDVEAEIESLLGALGDLHGPGRLQVTLMPGRSGLADGLRERLERDGYQVCDGPTSMDQVVRMLSRDGGCHVLHFLGHGAFDRDRQRAALFMEGEQGGVERVVDEKIAALLHAAGPSLRLVFLAACDSARRGPQVGNPFVGLAPKLIQVGIPAVVAMQDLVPIAAARAFARDFYGYLLEHGVVDRAMNQARLLLFEPGGLDWAIPVLFMRLKDGRLFAPGDTA